VRSMNGTHTGKTKTTQQHNDQNNFYYHIYKQTYIFYQLIYMYMYVSSTNVGNCKEYWQRHCIAIRNLVHGPESEIIPPPWWDFCRPTYFCSMATGIKILVVGCKIDAGWRHNKLVSLATHAIFNEGPQCIKVSYLGLICI